MRFLTTREAAWYIISVGSVCLSDDDFQKPCHRKFIFAHLVYLQGIWVKFVYEGHRIKVKVTGEKSPKSFIPQYKTLIGNNSTPVKHTAMKFATLRVAWGFWLWWIEWCHCRLCHMTCSDDMHN